MRLRAGLIALLTSWACLLGSSAVMGESPADASELSLSADAKRCLRKPAETPQQLQERASCLSYEAETAIIELLRTAAKLDFHKARDQVSWATSKVFEAESKGRPRAARALEALIRRPTTADTPLERVTLVALTSLTRSRLSRARDASKNKRAGLAPPAACAERVNDENPGVASEAQACVGASNQDWPDAALVEAATSHASASVRYGALKLLARMPELGEPSSRKLAEYLVQQREAPEEFREADVVCKILLRTTTADARWASWAGNGWSADSCRALVERRPERQASPLPQFRESVAGGRGICRTARTDVRDYVLLCAFDETHDASGVAAGTLMIQPSPVGTTRPDERSLRIRLLAGERLESKEVRHYYLPYERKPGEPWADVVRGLVVAPVSDRYRGTRRLLVYGLHYGGSFEPLWQSPECTGEGCRLDIVEREQPPPTHGLTGVLLLTEERAIVLDLKMLLSKTLNAGLGCPRLLGPLQQCSAFATPAPTSPR